jgi:AcrR family transcriptional regulator
VLVTSCSHRRPGALSSTSEVGHLNAKTTRSASTGEKRLPKAKRREQLLEIARAIVHAEGTDALTLASLAERAGVTRPITYEHFKTRSGLLIALARAIDDRQAELLLDELGRAPPRLPDVSRVASRAYMHCVKEIGHEWQSITAALKGDREMDVVQHELLERYADIYCDALAPCTKLSKRDLKRRCVAIIGAAEALARELHLGRIDERAAAATLSSLIEAWLSPRAVGGASGEP